MRKQFRDADTSTFAQATAAQYLKVKAGRMPATRKCELGEAIAFE